MNRETFISSQAYFSTCPLARFGWMVRFAKSPVINCMSEVTELSRKGKMTNTKKLWPVSPYAEWILQHSHPALKERGTFMADFALERFHEHPYARESSETHAHFKPRAASVSRLRGSSSSLFMDDEADSVWK